MHPVVSGLQFDMTVIRQGSSIIVNSLQPHCNRKDALDKVTLMRLVFLGGSFSLMLMLSLMGCVSKSPCWFYICMREVGHSWRHVRSSFDGVTLELSDGGGCKRCGCWRCRQG